MSTLRDANRAGNDTQLCGTSNGNGTKAACRRDLFGTIAAWTTRASGSRWASLGALMTVIVWASVGPHFHYSENWQLVINTGTTIVTFLMVFLIQNAQNRESKAIHLKLDELIHSLKQADNKMINIENLTEEQLDRLAHRYQKIAQPLHEKLESVMDEVEAKLDEIDDSPAPHASASFLGDEHGTDEADSRFDRRLPTTSLTDPIPSPSSAAPNS